MENIFVYFYSKNILQNFLSSNEQKVSSNEQIIMSNQQIVTSNKQKVTSNKQKVMNNKQKIIWKEQIVTSNKQKVTNNEQKLTSNKQQAKGFTSGLSKWSFANPFCRAICLLWNSLSELFWVFSNAVWTFVIISYGQHIFISEYCNSIEIDKWNPKDNGKPNVTKNFTSISWRNKPLL